MLENFRLFYSDGEKTELRKKDIITYDDGMIEVFRKNMLGGKYYRIYFFDPDGRRLRSLSLDSIYPNNNFIEFIEVIKIISGFQARKASISKYPERIGYELIK